MVTKRTTNTTSLRDKEFKEAILELLQINGEANQEMNNRIAAIERNINDYRVYDATTTERINNIKYIIDTLEKNVERYLVKNEEIEKDLQSIKDKSIAATSKYNTYFGLLAVAASAGISIFISVIIDTLKS